MAGTKKVVVAMSGGVDSSLAAALLLQQGYEVVGITLQIWQDVEDEEVRNRVGACCSLAAVEDARAVANRLGIPYYVLNFKALFADKVIDYFVNEYAAGRTPNPCIRCNKAIKFEALLDRALALGADYIATGHYCKIDRDPATGRYLLKKAVDTHKDQTYALYNMTQFQLAHTLFPLGGMTKTETRRLAEELDLPVFDKPDSQEICFIYDDNYKRFLQEKIPEKIKPGPFLDTKGNVLGTHEGLPFYTVGQRKGLGLALGKPMYVVKLDPERNAVILGEAHEVFSDGLVAGELNFIPFDRLAGPLEVTAKVRYSAKEAPAIIRPGEREGEAIVSFATPQRAITPGQAVVFYDGDVVVGGGTILKAL